MRIWVVKTSEMLAKDSAGGRLLRSGLIANLLDSRGHEVTWWVSTFDHARRRQRSATDVTERFGRNGTLRLLRSPGYDKVVSLRRFVDHAIWGWRFSRAIASSAPPDIIFCAYPTIESAFVSVRYAARHRIPVVLDLRDMWPDIFVEAVPRRARPLAKLAAAPFYWLARRACRGATALFGITEEFLAWGLRYAGRARNEFDAAYPLAFPRADFHADADASGNATRYWDDLGVTTVGAFKTVLVGSLNGQRYEMESVFAAARRLHQLEPGAYQFLICGDGENLERYKRSAADCPDVLFSGWLGPAQIRALLSRSHLGLVPYRNTPDFMMSVPNKAVEYLAAGLPVATSLRGTLPQVLHANGCGSQFDAAQPETLVELIRQMRQNPAAHAQMAERARELYEREFIAEIVYTRVAERLESMAAVGSTLSTAGRTSDDDTLHSHT